MALNDLAPAQRGFALEKFLTDLFDLYDPAPREAGRDPPAFEGC